MAISGLFSASSIEEIQVNAQTGTSYVLVLSDAGKLVTMNNAAASTLTIPPQSSVAWPDPVTIAVAQLGAGQVTIVAGLGVTLRSNPGLKIATQYQSATLTRIASDEWLVMGALVS